MVKRAVVEVLEEHYDKGLCRSERGRLEPSEIERRERDLHSSVGALEGIAELRRRSQIADMAAVVASPSIIDAIGDRSEVRFDVHDVQDQPRERRSIWARNPSERSSRKSADERHEIQMPVVGGAEHRAHDGGQMVRRLVPRVHAIIFAARRRVGADADSPLRRKLGASSGHL